MKLLKVSLIILGSVGVLFLGACTGEQQTAQPDNTPTEAKTNLPAVSPSKTAAKPDHSQPSKGGKVVETGKYHLEFVPEKEANGTHLDLYLQKGDTHEAVSNANVTAQVQLPNGSQKTLDMKYDVQGKHYAVLLPEQASGEYKVVILSEINGEKANGRFTFNR
ncbi:hypothetical protein NDI44_12905 [Trichocoleus sp. DQ-A3]|uniref:hypothetical protein n=1 Tax=Cyanophyceae TaxID=3028117 RepID=UPI001683FBC3|nr:hypothetical protein [Coleofasciculus sp. FACHB-125]MBD1900022.1 hypothetical protein [Coleofasciculus sp. FACHB-125]